MNEKMEEVREKIMHPKATHLSIQRVPIETANTFKQLANDKFVGDYGFCLKTLLESYTDDKFSSLMGIIEDQERRLQSLENKPSDDKIKEIKTISGRVLRIPAKE